MKLKDEVRVYLKRGGGWYNQGSVAKIADHEVEVDFGDWIQTYPKDDLRLNYILFEPVWIPISEGQMTTDFR